MARAAVTSGSLNKLLGVKDVVREIERRLPSDPKIGEKLKELYLFAGEPIQKHARKNIDRLQLSVSGRRLLAAMVVRGKGPAAKQNAFVAIYQFAEGTRAIRKSDTILNPYWIEFGTAMRTRKNGGSTGRITAQPFFRPAIPQARPEVKAILVNGLGQILIEAK